MPSLRSAFAFVAGLGVLLCVAQGPLWALVGLEARIHDRVNVVRREHHLRPLRGSEQLAAVAREHADDMARRGYRAHLSPEGKSALDRAHESGVDGFRLLAENIGWSNVPGDRVPAVIRAWLDSPSHRENLLNPAFNTSGVGRAETADGQTIVVQLFATFRVQRHASD